MNLLAKKAGLEIEYITGPTWDEFMGMMRAGNLDVMLNIIRTPEREKDFLFTKPYASNPNVILSRQKVPYDSLDQLKGKTVAVPKGFYLEEILRRKYPDIVIHTKKNVLDSMNAVVVGEADAVVGEVAIFNFLMSEHTMFGLALSKPIKIGDYDTSRLAIATGKTLPHLNSILQKAMKTITADEKTTLLKRWIGDVQDGKSKVDLTEEEHQWLKQHGKFTLGVDPSWAPFEFIDEEGVYSGIGSSYVDLVGSRLGITLTPETGLSWAAVLDKVRAGEIDILPTVARSSEREKYLNFSKPYISFPMVITTRKDAPFVDSLAGLNGKKVGVVRGYITQELIETNQKGIHVVPVQTLSEGLKQLNDGKLDAFIDNLLTITHEIDRSNLDDLKIASQTKYKFELSMAVRKGLPELVPILNKALSTMNEHERAAIVNSWTAIQISYGVDTKTILLWGVPLAIGAILILLIVVFWARYIQKQKRIIQQSEAQITREKEALEAVMDTVDYGILFMDPDLKARIMNRAYREMWDIDDEIAAAEPSVEDLIRYNQGKGFYDVTDEDFDEFVLSRVEAILNGTVTPIEVRQPNGRIVLYQCLALPDGRRMLTYLDITEQKNTEQAFRDGEMKIRRIFSTASEGIWMVDVEMHTTEVNDAMCKILGRPSEDIIGRSIFDFVDEANKQIFAEHAERRNRGESGSYEIGLSQPNGNQIPCLFNVTPIINEEGVRIGSFAMVTDITVRKLAETKLLQTNLDLATLNQCSEMILHSVSEFELFQQICKIIVERNNKSLVFVAIANHDEAKSFEFVSSAGFEEGYLRPGAISWDQDDRKGNGPVGQAFRSGKPFLVRDTMTDPAFEPWREPARERGFASAIALPLKIGDESFGVIAIYSPEIDGFDDDSIRILERLTNDTAHGVAALRADGARKEAEKKLKDTFNILSSSINYASRIQRSILPHNDSFSSIFEDFFVIWEPRDIVGGDIYWNRVWGDGILVILGDCTGHGVPGAFMTLIATGALDRAQEEVPPGEVGMLLQRMHQLMQLTLGQHLDEGSSDDGMELGACYLNEDLTKITFAGARFSLFTFDGSEVNEIKGDKNGIGYRGIPFVQEYTNNLVNLMPSNSYYMMTDGLIDQVGG
ncbi:MAG: transporter substrate-binding domain-containing protein, partial [Rhodospirillaceae bacterium]|nr:transporter substrate-binding domain-containing protein [Rhodospirillaceae bacterium]